MATGSEIYHGNLPEHELISALAKNELPSALADGLKRSRTRL